MPSATDERPDPDSLLAQLRQQEEAASRCRLRIYFGASAGVGKTFAMLQAARHLAGQGRAPLVGVVETHGRAETAALLDGLPRLPMQQVAYRDRTLPEFDLDGALDWGRKLATVLSPLAIEVRPFHDEATH